MIKIILLSLLFTSAVFASSAVDNKKLRLQKQVEMQKAKEAKYAKEQKFYFQDNYDFKGAQVNPESVKSLKEIEVDDLDMDSVYD